jgi:hypothetical protein
VTGFDRPGLWSEEHMFNRRDVEGVALVTSDPPQSADDLLGWTLIRRSAGGPRIGPLYADSSATAEAILARAVSQADVNYVKSSVSHSVFAAVDPQDQFNRAPDAEIVDRASLVVEVWGGNPVAMAVFERAGFKDAGVYYHRMWVDGKATPEFSEGGSAQREVFAIFDAAVG